MAWHLRRSTLVASISLPLALALACGDDECCDGADFDGGATTTTGATTGTTSATTTSTTPTTSSSGSTAATEGSTAATEGSTAAADSTTGPGEPVTCTEDLTCNPGEICVLPCCGGPQPGCSQLRPGTECIDGTLDEGGVSCCENAPDPKACMQMQWCIPNPCMADPPYCATTDEVTCNGTDCTTKGGCYGDLQNGQLQCSCK